MFTSALLEQRMHRVNDVGYALVPVGLLTAVMGGLIVLEPDFGTAVMIVLIVAVIVFAAGLSYRYVLGLGASTRALAEGFHDTPFERPSAKLRDVVTEVRSLLAGEQVSPRRVPGARPLRLSPPPPSEVPVWVAALGPRSIRVAAELGDGWIPALIARDQLRSRAAQVKRLCEASVVSKPALTVAAGPIAAVDDNPDVARTLVAACTAWYLSAMGGVYAESLSGQGYTAEVDAVLAANQRPNPRRATIPPAALPLLDQLAAYGTADQVRKQVGLWDEAPTSSPSCWSPACPGRPLRPPSPPPHPRSDS